MLNLNILLKPVNLIVVAVAGLMFSCTMRMPPQTTIEQGIEGHIYKVSGNQMPMKGTQRSKPKALICEVYIYKPTTVKQAQGQGTLYSQINTPLVAKVKTDSAGHYQVKLPVGNYSVFVKEGNQYFASESDGTGNLNPAEVFAGKVTTRNITVNHDAAY
ncbi:carboxypeptidase regulatory-like domain-containing protein [Mucilaginibacter galii]|nr:carboxypeptidase regulatory-like domain-containing protein [Mucilaginibacter galii]